MRVITFSTTSMTLQKHFRYNKIAYVTQQPEERLTGRARNGKVRGAGW
jgi:hypothetical protein